MRVLIWIAALAWAISILRRLRRVRPVERRTHMAARLSFTPKRRRAVEYVDADWYDY